MPEKSTLQLYVEEIYAVWRGRLESTPEKGKIHYK
jgi:hypothetical protein